MTKRSNQPRRLSGHETIVGAIRQRDHAAIVASLNACDDVRALSGKTFYCVPLGGMEHSPTLFADWLLERAATISADDAVGEFAFLILKRALDVDRVALIYGVVVDKTYDLGHGFSLEPASARPTTSLHLPAETRWGIDWKHETLLVRRVREKVRVLGQDEHAPDEDVWWHTESRSRELDEALGVITLALGSPVFYGVTWADLVGPFWLQRGYSTRTEGQMPAASRLQATEEHIAAATRLLNDFYNLGTHGDAVRVSLSRYRTAATPWDMRRSAVDIAVAYEGLLVSEKQAEATTLALCLRGAWLLETDAHRRLDTFRLLQKLYGIRSDLVHSGGRNWGVDKSGNWSMHDVRQSETLVRESINRFEALAKRLITGGYPKSWTEVILGLAPDAVDSK